MFDIELLEQCVWKDVSFFAKMATAYNIVNDRVVYTCIYGSRRVNDVVMNVKHFYYSEFRDVYDHIHVKYKLIDELPLFPPKHWWGNTSKQVISDRINAFDKIFKALNTVRDINNDDKLCAFFNLDLSDRRPDNDKNNCYTIDTTRYIIHDTDE